MILNITIMVPAMTNIFSSFKSLHTGRCSSVTGKNKTAPYMFQAILKMVIPMIPIDSRPIIARNMTRTNMETRSQMESSLLQSSLRKLTTRAKISMASDIDLVTNMNQEVTAKKMVSSNMRSLLRRELQAFGIFYSALISMLVNLFPEDINI